MPHDIFASYPRIASALVDEPWLILPSHHHMIMEQLESYTKSERAWGGGGRSGREGERPEGYVNRLTTFDKQSGLAVMDVRGVIGKGLGAFEMDCGGVCVDKITEGLDLLADIKPRAVQMYFDTPGGNVTGVEETGAAIREFANTVAPIHSYVDNLCCSAGEWLAANTSSRHAAGSATLGSIGVYSVRFDQTSRYAAAGVKVIMVSTGPLKGEGYPGTEVTPAHLAKAREQVDAIAADFFALMSARWPGTDPAVHFTGGTFRAKSAEGAALHDGLFPSRRAHLSAMMSQYPAAPARR